MAFIPHIEDGYLFYDELEEYGTMSGQIEWRNKVLADANNSFTKADDFIRTKNDPSQIIHLLRVQAQQERLRELQVLEQYFGADVKSMGGDILGRKFNEYVIQSFNKIVSATQSYSHTLDLIQEDLKNEEDGEDTLDAKFIQAIQTRIESEVSKEVYDILSQYITIDDQLRTRFVKGGTNAIHDEIADVVRKAIRRAVTDVARSIKATDYKDMAYEKLLDFRKKLDSTYRSPLTRSILKMLNVDELIRSYQKALLKQDFSDQDLTSQKFGHKLNKALISKTKKHLDNESSTFIRDLLSQEVTKAIRDQVSMNPNLKWQFGNVKSHRAGAKTYTILYDSELEIDSSAFEDLFQEVTNKNKDKTEVRRNVMQSEARLRMSKLNNYAVIWQSNKPYALGDYAKARGFNGTSFSYRSMSNLLASFGILGAADDANTALSAIMNTANGAYFQDRQEYADQVRIALSRALQFALFDDPQTIMSQASTRNMIHVFNMGGYIVPLSYMLECAQRAMNVAYVSASAGDLAVRFNVNYPPESAFIFRDGAQPEIEGSSVRWGIQREKAHSNTSFRIYFATNFMDILRGDFKDFLV